MSTQSSPTDVHAAVFDLLPWWVNGTLEGADAAMVDHHLQGCEECRSEVATQQRLRDAIRDDVPKVEHAPQASFERLWSRIEELDRDVPRANVDTRPPTTPPAGASPPAVARWRLAAAILLAVGAASLGTVSWRSSRQDDAALYHTATSGERADSAVPRIRAVFADATTVEELATITRAAGLTVVAGPTEAGVYTLALERNASAAAIDEAVVRLRDDPRVRFAEPVASREASR